MSQATDNLIGLIADDFTGALDAGVEFARAGLETILSIAPEAGQSASVRVIDIGSRDADPATARQRAAYAAQQLAGRQIFKKIDSTMRGHIGLEIEAILDTTGIEKALVCPAVIEAGRTVRNGQLYVNDLPLHQTDFARDPFWPATTSDLVQLVATPATHIPIEMVRSGALSQAIAAAPTHIVTADAHTHEDLIALSLEITPGILPCGALGLARAWAARFAGRASAGLASTVPPHEGPLLIVAGSRHPATAAQVNRLIAERAVMPIEIALDPEGWQSCNEAIAAALSAGISVVVRAPAEHIGQASLQRALVERLGELAAEICGSFTLGGLVLTGGETASAICRRLGVAAVRLEGEVEVGVPWSTIAGGKAGGLPLVTKAGGFGNTATLMRAFDMLQA